MGALGADLRAEESSAPMARQTAGSARDDQPLISAPNTDVRVMEQLATAESVTFTIAQPVSSATSPHPQPFTALIVQVVICEVAWDP